MGEKWSKQQNLLTLLFSRFQRLRVNCVGIFDVLTFDNSQNNPLALMAQFQVRQQCSIEVGVLAQRVQKTNVIPFGR